MNIAQGDKVTAWSPLISDVSVNYSTGVVTAVWPDASGNLDPAVAPVLCSVTAFPHDRAPMPLGQILVYALESAAGNAAGDGRGNAFVASDQVAPVAKPVQRAR